MWITWRIVLQIFFEVWLFHMMQRNENTMQHGQSVTKMQHNHNVKHRFTVRQVGLSATVSVLVEKNKLAWIVGVTILTFWKCLLCPQCVRTWEESCNDCLTSVTQGGANSIPFIQGCKLIWLHHDHYNEFVKRKCKWRKNLLPAVIFFPAQWMWTCWKALYLMFASTS